MKKLTRLFATLFIAALALTAIVFGSKLTVNADGPQTTSAISVLGAQVRTAGDRPGLRFVGKVDETELAKEFTNVSKYGILLAYGEVSADEIVIGATINGKSVPKFEVDPGTLTDGELLLTVYNIPASYYGQMMTTRMFVRLADDSVVYAETATTRNLADVSRTIYNTTTDADLTANYGESNLIETVTAACRVRV